MGSGFFVKNHLFCDTLRAACGDSVKEHTAHSVTLLPSIVAVLLNSCGRIGLSIQEAIFVAHVVVV